MKKQTKYLIIIGGPTAVGKTELSINIAQHFNCEIISGDSRQFYKEMNIGTAKPSTTELSKVKHHFINSLSIQDDYSVGQFEKEAITLLDHLYLNSNIAILTGGTGLYLRAITNGIDHFPKVEDGVKEQITEEYNTKGIKPLQEELQITDPDYYNKIDKKNPHRLIRALSVIRSTQLPFSSFLKDKSAQRQFIPIHITLDLPRERLYERINQRVDLMITQGLVQEAESLKEFQNLNALQTVGYTELFKYFNGEWTLVHAIEKIKQHTRNYAKRQLTWFRNQGNWNFMNPKDTGKIINYIIKQIEQKPH